VKSLVQTFSIKNMAGELIQRIRNPLNALLLNIDKLEEEIAETDTETSRERLTITGTMLHP
jgi:hypothetical protein